MTDEFLKKIYAPRDPEATAALYDAWADTYDDEIVRNGYVTPVRCARTLAKAVPDMTVPVLDFGCGTGLSGKALADAGFTTIDGIDISPQMLAKAKARGVYRSLTTLDAGKQPNFAPGTYDVITAIGAIGPGAAPPTTVDMLLRKLKKRGKLLFSLNDHALKERVYETRVNEWADSGAARLLHRRHGDHLRAQDIGCTVFMMEKA